MVWSVCDWSDTCVWYGVVCLCVDEAIASDGAEEVNERTNE
ncbi:unnamed protein product [Strongylus vulgaris]|uniref:Uncharacterized protein n=1 Tax=Strongylus vulgaris TaxID=40348 RepID=A0A3P7LFQ0_STRVU|nr:unnamed protein product [Strongylus vulgaris]